MEGCRKKTLQLGIDKKEDDSGLVVVEPLLQLRTEQLCEAIDSKSNTKFLLYGGLSILEMIAQESHMAVGSSEQDIEKTILAQYGEE
jgi:hypothetical protein